MSVRQILESYFTSYPTCEEEVEDLANMQAMSDSDFATGVIAAFEQLKERLRARDPKDY